MPYYKDEAIVLKRNNLGEADRIITLYSHYHGKIQAVAKGVRKTASKKGGNLELFNQIRLKLARGKSLDIITEVESLQTFSRLKENLADIGRAYYVCELYDKLIPEAEKDGQFFQLLSKILQKLNENGSSTEREILMRNFEIKFLKLSGYWSQDMFAEEKPATVSEWRRFNRIFIEQILGYQLKSVQAGSDLV